MPCWTIDLHARAMEQGMGPDLLGGKGANLFQLAREGFTLPRSFCLCTTAYRAVLEQCVLTVPPLMRSAEELQKRLKQVDIPGEIGQALAQAYTALKDGQGLPRLAVRSSATGEDSLDASHAGLAATFLNVVGFEEVIRAVRSCWASLWSEALLSYRQRANGPSRGCGIRSAPAMAVVIQAMVPAQVAGVLFTRNPVSGDPGEMVVSAAWGLGETVVSGGASDTYILDRQGGVLRRDLGSKGSIVEQRPEGGTRIRTLPRSEADEPCMPDELFCRLATLGRAVERCQGGPQDIEWATVDGRIYLLQARPITAMASGGPANPCHGRGGGSTRTSRSRLWPGTGPRRTDDSAAAPEVWSNANVGEALPGVATPMTWSIIRGFSSRGFAQAFASLGLSVPEDYLLVGNVQGRIYLNLSEFMSVASGIPFLTPELLSRMVGGVDPRLLEGAYRRASPLGFLLRLPLSVARVVRSQILGPSRVRAHALRFEEHRKRFFRRDLGCLPWEGLFQLFIEMRELFDCTGELLLMISSNSLVSYLALELVLKTGGHEARKLLGDLFTGLEDLSSAAPGLRLLELARKASALGLDDLFAEHRPVRDSQALLSALEACPQAVPFLQALADLLRVHGHRAVCEPELSTPRWREDPSFPLEVIATHLGSGCPEDPRKRQLRQTGVRRQATRRARRLLPPPLRSLFDVLLHLAQDAARQREQMRSCVTELIGIYRHLFLEVGQRLTEQELLGKPEQVFFLTIDELETLLREGPRCLMDRVLERQARYQADLAMPKPPTTFRGGDTRARAQDGSSRGEGPAGPTASGELVLQGLGCSPGQVRGSVRVLSSPRQGHLLRPGEILVAHTTDIGWTPLFLVAAGLVLDISGPLAHPAVVAREYGLPAVVNTARATELLRDGDLVLIDGREGTVRLLERAQEI